jgi:hypothetical protein
VENRQVGSRRFGVQLVDILQLGNTAFSQSFFLYQTEWRPNLASSRAFTIDQVSGWLLELLEREVSFGLFAVDIPWRF